MNAEMYNAADLWQYGAIDMNADPDGDPEDSYYGPLEFLELEEIQEFLQQNNIRVHDDELDVGDEKAFELQDGTRVDVECFTIMYKPMLAELGYDWDHADAR